GHRLLPPDDLYRGESRYPIPAYSEYMPAPPVGWKPYGGRGPDPELFAEDDPFGWHVGEFEEELELRAGLAQVGCQVLAELACFTEGHSHAGFPALDLPANP